MKIETGEYPPGQRLPTFDAIASDHDCSLAVVRKAIDLLKSQGLVITEQGTGTFVRSRPRPRRHGVDRYSRSRWSRGTALLVAEAESQGYQASQIIRELAEVPAPELVAERLDLTPGTTVWVRRRTTLVDQRPNQLADSYYPLPIVDGTAIRQENTGPGGGFARLEEKGHRLTTIREELSVRMPQPREVELLKLPPGTPVIDLIRTTFDVDRTPLEVMVAVIAGDMATFQYDFPIPE